MKALITGASSGMGRDMSEILAEKGYDLIITARRSDRLSALKNDIEAKYPSVYVETVCADLSDKNACIKLYESVKDKNIDFLINNAGFGLFGEFTETSLEDELRMIDTNITAVHILTKLFLKDFVKRDSGIILNVASSAGFMAGPLMSTYYATKNYVRRLTQAIYQELKNNKSNVKFAIDGLESRFVARYAIEKTLKGKLTIIPGKSLKLGIFSLRFLPEKLMLKMSSNIQSKKS